jgi:energy-coupling factor transporter transmembrane protein EcfT
VSVLFGAGGTIASTVYGTVVVMATLTAAYASEKDPWKLATTVAGAVLVLWIAHVYAHTLSEAVAEGRQKLYEMGSVARRELGIVLAAALPVASLLLGAIGVFRETTAVWVALGVGLLTLGVEGVRFARLEGLGRGGTLAATGLNVALGLFVVLLKVLIAH